LQDIELAANSQRASKRLLPVTFRNDFLHCETDLQDLAARVLRAGNHHANWCGAGLMAGNRQGTPSKIRLHVRFALMSGGKADIPQVAFVPNSGMIRPNAYSMPSWACRS
jgi:hypothetical protein